LFGRLDPHLRRRLEGTSSEIPQQVTYLLLRSVDQMPVRRGIDRIGNLKHCPLEILTHPSNQFVTIQLAEPFHG
jgi:hypothetical protein